SRPKKDCVGFSCLNHRRRGGRSDQRFCGRRSRSSKALVADRLKNCHSRWRQHPPLLVGLLFVHLVGGKAAQARIVALFVPLYSLVSAIVGNSLSADVRRLRSSIAQSTERRAPIERYDVVIDRGIGLEAFNRSA